MLPKTFATDTCFPKFPSFATREYVSTLKQKHIFAAGNNASRVAKLGNIGETYQQQCHS